MLCKGYINTIETLSYSNKSINAFILATFIGGALLVIPAEIAFWTIFLILFYGILENLKGNNKQQLSLVYFTSAAIIGLYTIITHIGLVKDPWTDVFITIDSMGFHQVGLDVSQNNWSDFIPFIISQFLYSDYYLFSLILGTIYKICLILHIQDALLVSKLFNSVVGAATIGITYSCISLKIKKIPFKTILWFILFSPLIENSATLMRDIYVCFFYVWAFYYVIIPQVGKRTLKIILLSAACVLIRPENGIFLFSFLFVCWYAKINRLSKKRRYIIYTGMIILFCLACMIVIPIMNHVLDSYQTRDIAEASSGSFGVMLKRMPIPLNLILPAIFSQIMPFPFWQSLSRPFGGEYLIFSIFSSFYWISIWSVIIFALYKHWRVLWHNEKKICMTLLIAMLYIIMTSYGEVNVRRIMGVYPIIFVVYMLFKDYVRYCNRIKLSKAATTALITLNLIYFIIK